MDRFQAKMALTAALLFIAAFLSPVSAEPLSQTFAHELVVTAPAQSWEHRIDLPEELAAKGQIFVRRALEMTGPMVIEREQFTPTYYYVKVRLPKLVGEPMKGILKVDLELGTQPVVTPVPGQPTGLAIAPVSPALRPVFIWKGTGPYYAVSLYDVDENRTVMERVVIRNQYCSSTSEEWLKHHHYRWAVKQADETGRWSREAQAGFRIEVKDGVVVTIPE